MMKTLTFLTKYGTNMVDKPPLKLLISLPNLFRSSSKDNVEFKPKFQTNLHPYKYPRIQSVCKMKKSKD